VADRIGTAILELATNSAQFKSDLADIKNSATGAFSSIRQTAGIVAGAFAALDLASVAKDAVDNASAIADSAARIGDSAENVQRLTFAIEQGGGSFESLDTAIKSMSNNLVEGPKSAVSALEKLGLNIEELKQLSPTEAFTAIAEAIRKVPDPMEQSALAIDLFGRSGQQVLPAIKAGIKEVGDAAPVMANQTVEALDTVGDKWQETEKRLNAIKADALAPLLELFTSMPTTMQTIVGGIATFMPSLEALALGLLAIGGPSGAMAAITAVGAGVVTFLTVTLPAAFSAILPFLGPVGLIAAGVAAVVVVWKNWDTITTIVKNVYNAVKEWLVDKFAQVVNWIGEKVGMVTGFFKTMAEAVALHSYVPDMVNRIAEEFGRLDVVMVKPTQTATGLVMSAFQQLMPGIAGVVKSGFDVVKGIASAFSGDFGGIIGGIVAGINLAKAAWQGLKHLLGGGEEGVEVNPRRDQFFAQYGGYEGLAEKLTAASDGNIAEELIRRLYDAETLDDFRNAEDAIIALIGGQKFGKGGIVMKPTLGLVGEAGPEAVIPLNRYPSMDRPIEVVVQLDGLTIARAVARNWSRTLSHSGLA
jgi:minor tail protein